MIPIQNIYYMLSYAFQILNEQGYKNIATEQFMLFSSKGAVADSIRWKHQTDGFSG